MECPLRQFPLKPHITIVFRTADYRLLGGLPNDEHSALFACTVPSAAPAANGKRHTSRERAKGSPNGITSVKRARATAIVSERVLSSLGEPRHDFLSNS
jgi:hypothetical protein